MHLLDELREEHARIDRVLGALRTYVARRARGEELARDGGRFLRFLRLYADRFHHGREEKILFPALVEHLEVSASRGPIAALLEDHDALRGKLASLAEHLDADLDDASAKRLEALATEYARALWLHIDAENSVLFVEAEERLPRAGVRELPTRAPDEEEARARDDADALIERWPPSDDRGIVRGAGCVACPNFGVRCNGVEHEWWSEAEWDELPDRIG